MLITENVCLPTEQTYCDKKKQRGKRKKKDVRAATNSHRNKTLFPYNVLIFLTEIRGLQVVFRFGHIGHILQQIK